MGNKRAKRTIFDLKYTSTYIRTRPGSFTYDRTVQVIFDSKQLSLLLACHQKSFYKQRGALETQKI